MSISENSSPDTPAVSIIMPVYNAALTVERAINSVRYQTRRDIELIAINDGSTDNSLEILQSLAREDSRVRVYNIPNSGVSTARNVGLDHVRGSVILFLDADDLMDQSMVFRLSQTIDDGFDLSVCGYKVIGNESSFSQIPQEKEWSSFELDDLIEELQNCNAFNMLWNKAFRADLIQKYQLRFNPSISNGEDYYFILEYLRCGTSCYATLSADLYQYKLSSAGLTANSDYADVSAAFARISALNSLLEDYSLPKRAAQQAMLQFAYTLLSNSKNPKSDLKQIKEQPLFSELSAIEPVSLKYRVFLSLLKQDNVVLMIILINVFKLIKKVRGRSYSW